MIIIAIIAIGQDGAADVSGLISPNFSNFPTLFGATIYAFMCHHRYGIIHQPTYHLKICSQCLIIDSIPGLLAPIETKKRISLLFFLDFLAIITAYLLLAYSAVFAYADEDIPSTYTTFFDGHSILLLY